jgi:hypothetical protein
MHLEDPTYEKIRRIPVRELMLFQNDTLAILEREIKSEINRATSSLAWIKGIKRVKQQNNDGGKNVTNR